MADKPKLIVILGPTASGKSDLAVEIALRLRSGQARKQFGINGAEIISADSRQVYKGMDLGSGKIAKKEMKGVSHWLLDVASPRQRFTAAQFQKMAKQAIKKIQSKGKLPIICGGTGFYIRAITENLPIPEVKPDLKLRKELEKKSAQELFKELKKLDPVRASNIDAKNKRRLIRALEIIYKTGKPVPQINSSFCKGGGEAAEPEDLKIPRPSGAPFMKGGIKTILFLGVKKPEPELKKRIALRLQKRFKQGMIKEVQNLRNSGVSWKRLEGFGLEYKWLALFLQNKISRQEMILRLQKDIEHFAKRQLTFFKKYPGEEKIKWVKNLDKAAKITKTFLKN